MKRLTVVVFFGFISLAGLPMLGRTDSSVRAMTVLSGNTHSMARREFDHGLAPDSLPMERMLLVLKRSPEKEASLEKLLAEQLDQNAKNFRNWLTPDQFGRRFGLSDNEVDDVTSWLQTNGFEAVKVSTGRTVIEFSGTAGQVREAFHTEIHKYVVAGEEHWANASDPQIPKAVTSLVEGIDTLHNFPKKPLVTLPNCAQSAFQSSKSCYGVAPYDFATIYNVQPLWDAGLDGSGQTIAILAASDINVSDVRNFRQVFGLPSNDPQIVVNGRNPGVSNEPQAFEKEAVIDTEWAGAVAPGASIRLIVSASTNSTSGFDLSAEYAVDNNVAPVLSGSYSFCESTLGAAGNQFHNRLWQQAAAQGMTVVIGTGDGGAADCDAEKGASPPAPARLGLTVNGIASTPYNVAVGGTDFRDLTTADMYWNSVNNPNTHASAKGGYIPETAWNDSCANVLFAPSSGFVSDTETNCNNRSLVNFVLTAGGGGGRSAIYSKPAWQAGPGVPADGARDIPDISLFSGSGQSGNFYLFCEADLQNGAPCSLDGSSNHLQGAGGTSISGPAFAGMMALVAQNSNSRQGNPNTVLYNLAIQQPGAFHDITTGTIAMPCVKGSADCATANAAHNTGLLAGYDAGVGYDLATGLGSVNAFNFVTASGWLTNSWITDADNNATFNVPDRGAASSTTPGTRLSVATGYAGLELSSMSAGVAGVAILGVRHDGIAVAEASIPAAPALTAGRLYAEVGGAVDTGIAIANLNDQAAPFSFFFTDETGQDFGSGNFSIPAHGQVSKFLSERPFNGSIRARTFTFQAGVPVSVAALRCHTNERADFLITALPLIDLSSSADLPTNIPHFAQGGGWTTQIILVNPADEAISGNVQFGGLLSASSAYTIAARSSIRVDAPSLGTGIQTGWIQTNPDPGRLAPLNTAIISFKNAGVAITETGLTAVAAANSFRLYVENSRDGSMQTGIGIMNTAGADVTVTLESTNGNGSSLGRPVSMTVPSYGHASFFLNEIAGLVTPLQGVVRISASSPISVIGLRSRLNEKGDVLMTPLPAVVENPPAPNSEFFFPYFADGAGFTTEFIVFGVAASGLLRIFSNPG